MIELKRLGNIYGYNGGNYAGNIYDTDGLSPNIHTPSGENTQPMIIESQPISTNGTDISGCIRATYYKNGERNIVENINKGQGYEGIIEPQIVAMRGRNPENPSDRTPGIHTEQRLELGKDGISNCITSIQKDGMVLEKEVIGGLYYNPSPDFNRGIMDGMSRTIKSDSHPPAVVESEIKINKVGQISNEGSQCDTVVDSDGLYPTVSAGTHGYANPHLQTGYRIRKLTPLECWRLMGFSDEDFRKAEAVNSNTQLYKEAGNAIVVNVLMAVFGMMFVGRENAYKSAWNV